MCANTNDINTTFEHMIINDKLSIWFVMSEMMGKTYSMYIAYEANQFIIPS